MTALLIHCLK